MVQINSSSLYKVSARSGMIALPMVVAALTGCQPTATAYAPPEGYYPMYYPSMGAIEPAAGPQPSAPAYHAQPVASVSSQQLSQVDAALSKVDERLQRVEKAMLRLDRRMQLVERNELNRMTDAEPAKTSSLSEGVGSFAAAGGSGMAYSAGFQPVSSITSSLQAAPRNDVQLTPVAYSAFESVSGNSAARGGMASLADDVPAAVNQPSADNELVVWSVNYQSGKVWPDRVELPGSRDVVSALKSGRPVTIFARGKQPNAVVFRDRVKALSQYLAKAGGQDSVPIAALPGSHLSDNTVEIFATY